MEEGETLKLMELLIHHEHDEEWISLEITIAILKHILNMKDKKFQN